MLDVFKVSVVRLIVAAPSKCTLNTVYTGKVYYRVVMVGQLFIEAPFHRSSFSSNAVISGSFIK